MMADWLGLPELASAHGGQIDDLIVWVHILMLVLFVGWGSFYVLTLFKFRQSKHAKADHTGVTGHTSSYLEVTVGVIETVLLIGFSIPVWSSVVVEMPDESEATVVRVVAQQFQWNIHYAGPDGVFGPTRIELMDDQSNPVGIDRDDPAGVDDIWTINQLHLPVNKPALIYLTSKDVIHSFGLPIMRVKQDIIPGMRIPVSFTPIKTGRSEIACAQLCGLGHYRMRGFLTIETQEEFDAWIAEELEYLQPEEEDEPDAEQDDSSSTEG